MNLNNVISLPVDDSLAKTVTAYKRVKLQLDASTGLASVGLAGNADIAIGTVLQDTDADHADKRMADIQVLNCGVHYATFSNTGSAVVIGDLIQAMTGGLVTKATSAATAHGQTFEAAGANGEIIRVIYFDFFPRT